MSELVVIAFKALFGGSMVISFAVIGHLLRPKWFAGLFAAAPSVAIASLAVTAADNGHHDASLAAFAMLFGIAGFVAFSLTVRPLLNRRHVVVATSLSAVVWIIVALTLYLSVTGS